MLHFGYRSVAILRSASQYSSYTAASFRKELASLHLIVSRDEEFTEGATDISKALHPLLIL